MVNAKAYIRTFEALAAIILVLLVTIYVIKQQTTGPLKIPSDIALFQATAIKQITEVEDNRACIFEWPDGGEVVPPNCINLDKFKPETLDYTISICKAPCSNPPLVPLANQKLVYAKSFILAANLTHYEPKVVRLYIWRKI
ncbi:hypothetical protein J4471_05225 [Candidatus Woesearchaeota archaeon]|nr:hypothetical protein [Candidatus Woesearchaeota archaeon]